MTICEIGHFFFFGKENIIKKEKKKGKIKILGTAGRDGVVVVVDVVDVVGIVVVVVVVVVDVVVVGWVFDFEAFGFVVEGFGGSLISCGLSQTDSFVFKLYQ